MSRTYTISILICDVLPEWTQGAVSRAVKETLRSCRVPQATIRAFSFSLLKDTIDYATRVLKHSEYMSQMLYAGQSAREIVPFLSYF